MAEQALPLFDKTATSGNRFEGLRASNLSAEEGASVVALALSVLERKHRRGRCLTSPEATRDYLRLELGERHNELFGVLFLDNRHRVISKEEMFYRTIDGASVHPRVVVARALTLNAAAVMFFHNHPTSVRRFAG
jgi:DNA repair protein RadC